VTRYFTTLDISPDEVHALGLSEVARIRQEMDAIIQETGFNGSFAEFLNFLRTDPQFYATSRDDLLMRASYIQSAAKPGITSSIPIIFRTVRCITYLR